MRTILFIGIFFAIVSASRSASAGLMCMDASELDQYTRQLEATARSQSKAKDLSDMWSYCLFGDQKRKDRIVKACTAIVARLDPDVRLRDDDLDTRKQLMCLPALAAYGVNPIKTKTKDVDYIGDLLAKKYPAHDDPSDAFRTMEQSRDPRVLPKVTEWYRDHLNAAAKKPLVGWRAENWIRWHRAALTIIEKLGTKSDLAFLDEVKGLTKDRRVHAWVEAARKAIEKR